MSNDKSADFLNVSIKSHLNLITKTVNSSFQGGVFLSNLSNLCED